MSDSQNFGFAKLVPGFDFLQNLAKGTSDALPQMPGLSNWVAPTLNVEEIDKRIQELRAVHFWLEQNTKALSATIQALEVQKMTLATLQGMNCSMADLAQAMQVPGMGHPAAPAAPATPSAAAPEPASRPGRKAASKSRATPAEGAAGVVDPMQWWGSLTQQFQTIAATAMQDAAQKTADTARDMADNAQAAAASAAPPAPAKKAARKPASRPPAPARKAARRAGG
jgi:hypothetical protein